uniref:Uncharacterized protein n=1 Tax=Anopheles quadriannulatus TaxID=34691 RepID=A0A182XSU4_ANOQN
RWCRAGSAASVCAFRARATASTDSRATRCPGFGAGTTDCLPPPPSHCFPTPPPRSAAPGRPGCTRACGTTDAAGRTNPWSKMVPRVFKGTCTVLDRTLGGPAVLSLWRLFTRTAYRLITMIDS